MSIVGVLDLGLDLKVWPWVWLGVAVVFIIVELTVLPGSFILLPFSVSAFVASILGFYDQPIELQWLVFLLLGALGFAGLYRWARRFNDRNVTPLGVGADRLVGMTATVTAAIKRDDADRRGRVKVAGEDWGALTEEPTTIEPGAQVRVVAMQGTRVVVRPIAESGPSNLGGPPS